MNKCNSNIKNDNKIIYNKNGNNIFLDSNLIINEVDTRLNNLFESINKKKYNKRNDNGSKFETYFDLESILSEKYTIVNNIVYDNGVQVGKLFLKNQLYSILKEEYNLDYKEIVNTRLLPDEGLILNNKVYIIEKKFQNCNGSVDEKLQTCDYKLKYYNSLFSRTTLSEVKFIYFLSDWFKKEKYNNVRDYITSVNCEYYYKEDNIVDIF